MKVTEKSRIYFSVGRKIMECLKQGEKLNALTVKNCFEETALEASAVEVYSSYFFIRGLTSDIPSSNMSYYEALGHSVRYINFNNIKSFASFVKALRDKANHSGFQTHPNSRFGLSLIEATLLAALAYGVIGYKDFPL